MRYQIVMGGAALAGCPRGGLGHHPGHRVRYDDNLPRDALLENIHRVQLNLLEEAAAYQQLLDEIPGRRRASAARALITNMIRLLKLPGSGERSPACCRPGMPRPAVARARRTEAQEELAMDRREGPGRCEPPRRHAGQHEANRRPITATRLHPRRRGVDFDLRMPGLQDVAERLSTTFDTRVTVWANARVRLWWSSARSMI